VLFANLALGVLFWQSRGQVGRLRSEVASLQQERQALEAQSDALQGTVAILEDRLRAVEASDPAGELAALRATVEAVDQAQELAAVKEALARVQERLGALETDLEELAYPAEAPGSRGGAPLEDALPPEARLAVPRQRQSHRLSCEASAASMVAQYWGMSLSEADVLQALPLNDNPHLGFRGNVDGPTGGLEDYGVYAEPLMAVLNDYGLQARPVADGLVGIRAALARSNPVVAWVTYDCLPGSPTVVNIAGEAVILVPYQHAVVVTGYNAEGVWANDPWDGEEDFYPNADFDRALGYLGDMAIEVSLP